MSNETFQIIISAAVGLGILSMVMQLLVALAVYRSARDIAARLSPFFLRTKAIFVVEKETIRRIEIVIDKTLLFADILENVVPRIGTLAVRVEGVAARAMQLAAPVTGLERSAERVGTSAHFLFLEMRPRLASVAAETSALVGAADAQFRRIGRVFHDAFTHFVHLRQIVASKTEKENRHGKQGRRDNRRTEDPQSDEGV